MTKEDESYLRGWRDRARSVRRWPSRETTRAGIVVALWSGWPYDPFTPYGAGLADAALSAFGYDA